MQLIGLSFKSIQQLIQLNNNNNNTNSIKKWAEDLNRYFSKEDIQMAKRHMKRYSLSLIIRKMQIKTIMRYHLTPIRMVITKKPTKNKLGRECGEQRTLSHCWWECKLVPLLWKTGWKFLKKLKIELPWKKKKSVSCSVASQLFVLQSMDCSPPGSSFHGILQAKILEWVANPFSRGSSWLRNQTQVSCIAGGFFKVWATSSVQPLSGVWLFPTPWTAAHQTTLSITNSWSLVKLMSIELAISSCVVPFSSLSTSNGRTLCSSSSRLLPPLQSFLNHHCTVYSLAVPRPNALLMFEVVFAAL